MKTTTKAKMQLIALAAFLGGPQTYANADAYNELAKVKHKEGVTCQEMVGTWYSDTTYMTQDNYISRDIIKIERKANGALLIKGVNVFWKDGFDFAVNDGDWVFPGRWSCANGWYTEAGSAGYHTFKIKSLSKDKIVYTDEYDWYDTGTKKKLFEYKSIKPELLQKYPTLR